MTNIEQSSTVFSLKVYELDRNLINRKTIQLPALFFRLKSWNVEKSDKIQFLTSDHKMSATRMRREYQVKL